MTQKRDTYDFSAIKPTGVYEIPCDNKTSCQISCRTYFARKNKKNGTNWIVKTWQTANGIEVYCY